MGMKKVATIVAMKALVHHEDTDLIFLTTPHDLWLYDADSVTADDATDVIQPTNVAGAGRWLRIRFKAEDLDGSAGMPAHKTAHQDGGADEISLTGLAGLSVTPQTPAAHKTAHEDGGADEISLTGLAGLSVTPQTPAAHKTSHEDGGADEISLTGLAGLSVTPQTPAVHAASHSNGGSDPLTLDNLTGPLGFAKGGTGATTEDAFIADPAGGAVVDAESRTAIALIIDALISHNIVAAS